jgi:hypothetical protein
MDLPYVSLMLFFRYCMEICHCGQGRFLRLHGFFQLADHRVDGRRLEGNPTLRLPQLCHRPLESRLLLTQIGRPSRVIIVRH